MKKKLALALILTLALGMFAGCSKKQDDATNQTQNQTTNETESQNETKESMTEVPLDQVDTTKYNSYFEMASSWFIMSTEEKSFDGDSEFYITYNRFTANADGSVITINYSGVTGAREKFQVDYTIADDQVVEQVYRPDAEEKDRLNSIIPGFVVLDGEIKKDNSWNQDFTYDGADYTAETTITEVTDETFSTETVVRNIDVFTDGTYTEHRTYTKGEGLTYFDHTKPAAEADKEANVIAYRQQ